MLEYMQRFARRQKCLVRRHKFTICLNIMFFYLGCVLTFNGFNIECAYDRREAEKSSEEFDKVEYTVLILSAPDNILRRDAIRSTWMNFGANIVTENGERFYKWNQSKTERRIPKDFIKFNFVIAIKGLDNDKVSLLLTEENKFKDLMLLQDVEDGYTSLSDKMLSAFQMVNKNYKNFVYVIKCDDDSFVRIDLIIKELDAYLPAYYAPEQDENISFKTIYKTQPIYKGVYWGYFNGRARVYLSGKWKEEDWFLCDKYLPYALGGGYVVSRSIVEYVARNAEFLSKYNSEDVSLGVWTSALDAINRVHDKRFDTEWTSRGCTDNLLVRHKQTPNNMYQMYKNLLQSQGRRLCNDKTVVRKPYLYKWDVLPSQCCL